jgi:Cu/Ag efflux protein CusF
MAQVDDVNIAANPSGLQMRTEVNQIFQALNSGNKGSSRPASAEAGSLWIDDSGGTTWILKQYDGSNDITIGTIDTVTDTFTAAGTVYLSQGILSKSATYTVLNADSGKLITFDATGGACTANIDAPGNLASSFVAVIQKVDSSSNAVTIDPNAANTVNGASTLVLSKQWDAAFIFKNGNNISAVVCRFYDPASVVITGGTINGTPIGGTTPAAGAFTTLSATGLATLSAALNEAKGSDIASATTTNIGAATGTFVDITGTTTITGLGTIQAGTRRICRFTGAGLTLTYNATSLILPTNASIVTEAGDIAEFVSLGSGNWVCTNYTRDTGRAINQSRNSIASASTVNFANLNADMANITGTTTITALGTMAAGVEITAVFAASLTLTHNGTSLILPGAANITTAANDTAIFRSLGSGNWICISYQKADGTSVVGSLNTDQLAKAWVNFAGSTSANVTGTYSGTGTTTTFNVTGHGMKVGHRGYADFTSGGGNDGVFEVTSVTNANTFVATMSAFANTSGNVTLNRRAINSSYNVSNVAYVSTGNLIVNFTNSMTNTHYLVNSCIDVLLGSYAVIGGIKGGGTKTVNSFDLQTYQVSGGASDAPNAMHVTIFGP